MPIAISPRDRAVSQLTEVLAQVMGGGFDGPLRRDLATAVDSLIEAARDQRRYRAVEEAIADAQKHEGPARMQPWHKVKSRVLPPSADLRHMIRVARQRCKGLREDHDFLRGQAYLICDLAGLPSAMAPRIMDRIYADPETDAHFCRYCGLLIRQDELGTWVDTTEGDICGHRSDGGDLPHESWTPPEVPATPHRTVADIESIIAHARKLAEPSAPYLADEIAAYQDALVKLTAEVIGIGDQHGAHKIVSGWVLGEGPRPGEIAARCALASVLSR